jgi:hypothetical protein
MKSETFKPDKIPIYESINPRPYYGRIKDIACLQLSNGELGPDNILQIKNFFDKSSLEFIKEENMPYDPNALMIICYLFLCLHTNLLNSVNVRFNESFDLKFSLFYDACVELIEDIEQSSELFIIYNLLSAHINTIEIS